MSNIAVYPGTFDPVTNGHLDVIKRVASIYDKVYVSVAASGDKHPFFSLKERIELLREAVSCEGIENAEIEEFGGLVVNYAESRGAKVVVRGIRMISDFEYEFQMALTNRRINPRVETVFMMPNARYSYLSSRLIKEVAALGADMSDFVPPNVRKKLKERIGR